MSDLICVTGAEGPIAEVRINRPEKKNAVTLGMLAELVSAGEALKGQVWQQLGVPVIAAIEGVCFGAGLQIALGADFRIAAPDASLSIMEAKWGLIPDMGISLSLPKLMPVDRAKALIMTGRVLSGGEALGEGLVTRVEADPLAEARVFAEELCGKSPDAIRAGKALSDAIWGGVEAEGLKVEAELQAQLMGAPNQIETVMARMQKRAPKY
ncbi:enoyl-CoA hydratase-related protein [Octadecabacter ascidiaceicola]|uniref:Carnitinyl-CoA dehydratase n=1 Tax=Octadecabacter ascidiaceicola TaxID=1655543 RepID=A0A238JNQ5_9RHOB|nr:enoyl-CoA hydratase-related protein [Octadecabacter ascidiaceicola]SMX32125.1 Carnitinyl-CoA dehydratase [Octadecabacter ascidiaceicola]